MAKKAGGKKVSQAVTRVESAFPIVGVGASAGGLEAFTQLLEHLPATSGMAYVLIQHLDPTHASQLPEILSRKSAMPVEEIRGETRVEANHVYVISASENLRIEKGILQPVARPTEAGVRNMVIDDFFESLALDRGNLAFGIVLSGTASDGTIGLRAIKSEGGITFAQDPSTAKVRWHAQQRDRSGGGRFRAAAAGDREAAVGAGGASVPESAGRAGGRGGEGCDGRGFECDFWSAAVGYRDRFHLSTSTTRFCGALSGGWRCMGSII